MAPEALDELRAWLEAKAYPGAKTLGGFYRIAGQARWATAWQALNMQWDARNGRWFVRGSVSVGTVGEAAANGQAQAERYRTASGPDAIIITVVLPVRQ